MPVNALPQSTAPLAGAVRLRREYRDALGRPMTGRARITGAQRAQDGDVVTVAAPVVAPVLDGALAADLPPGTYVLHAQLSTVDGARVDDTETVTLS